MRGQIFNLWGQIFSVDSLWGQIFSVDELGRTGVGPSQLTDMID